MTVQEVRRIGFVGLGVTGGPMARSPSEPAPELLTVTREMPGAPVPDERRG